MERYRIITGKAMLVGLIYWIFAPFMLAGLLLAKSYEPACLIEYNNESFGGKLTILDPGSHVVTTSKRNAKVSAAKMARFNQLLSTWNGKPVPATYDASMGGTVTLCHHITIHKGITDWAENINVELGECYQMMYTQGGQGDFKKTDKEISWNLSETNTNPDSEWEDHTLCFTVRVDPGCSDPMGLRNTVKLANTDSEYAIFNAVHKNGTDHILNTNNHHFPVKYASINIKEEANKKILSWITQAENNNSHFVIESSADGVNFSNAGMMEGGGTTTSAESYQFISGSESTGNYFRVKQVEFNGQYSYSNTVVLKADEVEKVYRINFIQPNPVHFLATMSYNCDEETKVNFKVIDPFGNTVMEEKRSSKIGKNLFLLDVEGWEPGKYKIRMTKGDDVEETTFMKK